MEWHNEWSALHHWWPSSPSSSLQCLGHSCPLVASKRRLIAPSDWQRKYFRYSARGNTSILPVPVAPFVLVVRRFPGSREVGTMHMDARPTHHDSPPFQLHRQSWLVPHAIGTLDTRDRSAAPNDQTQGDAAKRSEIVSIDAVCLSENVEPPPFESEVRQFHRADRTIQISTDHIAIAEKEGYMARSCQREVGTAVLDRRFHRELPLWEQNFRAISFLERNFVVEHKVVYISFDASNCIHVPCRHVHYSFRQFRRGDIDRFDELLHHVCPAVNNPREWKYRALPHERKVHQKVPRTSSLGTTPWNVNQVVWSLWSHAKYCQRWLIWEYERWVWSPSFSILQKSRAEAGFGSNQSTSPTSSSHHNGIKSYILIWTR